MVIVHNYAIFVETCIKYIGGVALEMGSGKWNLLLVNSSGLGTWIGGGGSQGTASSAQSAASQS